MTRLVRKTNSSKMMIELYNNECTNNTGCTNTSVQCGEKPPTNNIVNCFIKPIAGLFKK